LKIQFWQESVSDLKQTLSTVNIPLIISEISAHDSILELTKSQNIDRIITHIRMNHRDREELSLVTTKCKIPVVEMGDLTLFDSHNEKDLSLDLLRPFTKFKKYAEANWKVPEELQRPKFMTLNSQASNSWPTGGESAGLSRLQDYLYETKACLHYHETRNGMIERDDSSKFSSWLAWGCLSQRRVYHELKNLEQTEGIVALIYELIWRDYFKFLAGLTKEKFFHRDGILDRTLEWNGSPSLCEQWRRGETGEDFVDANMRELRLTGLMSNRGRQNVASFFAKKLRLDWTLGARWFEQQLIDEDPENNWGNWLYLAGVGTDPRDRMFDVKKQAKDYDPSGSYRQKWLNQSMMIEEKILSLLSERSIDSTICPSEALPLEDKKNKEKMEEVRSSARRLQAKGQIDFFQKGEKVEPYTVRGPIRLKKLSQD
jgi:deoxyribodipyrimidine photo-lyase